VSERPPTSIFSKNAHAKHVTISFSKVGIRSSWLATPSVGARLRIRRRALVCDGDDSAIVTALAREQLMPLSRLNDRFEIELEGIAFGMVDRQGHRWRCLITDRVLSAAIGGVPTRTQKSDWFRANRSSVERVASNKFDMGAFEKDGFISITHWRRRG
jgi:hypothetical protein